MGKYRIYASKMNTIMEDYPWVNTAQNEVGELWYGTSGVTRNIQCWDVAGYRAKVYEIGLPIPSAVTSAICVFHTLFPILESGTTAPDVGFEFYYLDQSFNGGTGYDHTGTKTETGYSNWYSASTVYPWTSGGGDYTISAFTGTATEDALVLSGDITTKYNFWTFIDLGYLNTILKYTSAYENLTGETRKIKKIYTKYTHTLFQPYIDVIWDDTVKEDRDNVLAALTGTLYLFTYKDGILADPSSVNEVTISGDGFFSAFTSHQKVRKGIYKFDWIVPSTGTGTYTDTWNITYTGSVSGNVVQSFTVNPLSASSTWSSTVTNRDQIYVVSIPDLKESYIKGEEVMLPVKFRREYSATTDTVKYASFAVYIKDGNNKFFMYDWTDICYNSSGNYIILDTSWFIPDQTYWIDIQYTDGQSTFIDNLERTFRVIE